MDKGSQRNMDREAQLAKYWSASAIPMRHIDEELSNIYDHKAKYWVNPENYSDEQVSELGIGLNEVRGAYSKMLSPISYRRR